MISTDIPATAGCDVIGSRLSWRATDAAAARAAVMEKVDYLIEYCKGMDPEWMPPPFNPETYTRALGIPVLLERTPEDWDAIYVPMAGKPHIILNMAVRSPGRRRFSLSHEVIHSFFDDSTGLRFRMRSRDRKGYDEDPGNRLLESCCDAGAAELLMPRSSFRAVVDRAGFRASALPEVAETFQVSREAAAVRMVELAAEPCAVGFFHYAARSVPEGRMSEIDPSETQEYRVRRVFHSAGFPFLFPPGRSVLATSVVHESSLHREEMTAEEEFTLKDRTFRLRVSAFPLHRSEWADEPPTVCAVFRRCED